MRFRLLWAAAVLTVMLAACRGGEPLPDSRPTPISAADAAVGGGSAEQGGGIGQVIALRLWTQQSETFDTAYRALADAYTAANPGVIIAIESFDAGIYATALQDALASGAAADVVQMTGATVCVYSANLSAAPEAIIAAAPQDAFPPVLLGGFVCDGALYGLPQETAIPWGLAVSGHSQAAAVAWDFVRFAALDPANAAAWNAATGTTPALSVP